MPKVSSIPNKKNPNERFTTPDRVWSKAKSKLLGPIRIQRLKWKHKNADKELVHSGKETVRVYAEDLSRMKYFPACFGQITDDELKKMLQLTGIRLQPDCKDRAKSWTTFIGDLKLTKDADMSIVSGLFQHPGTKKIIEIKGEPSPSPYWARTFFFQEFNDRFPGCKIEGDKLEAFAPKNNPNN